MPVRMSLTSSPKLTITSFCFQESAAIHYTCRIHLTAVPGKAEPSQQPYCIGCGRRLDQLEGNPNYNI